MALVFSILRGTPWWVYALFGLLTYLGLLATMSRTISLWRLVLTPTVFLAWGIATLVQRSHFAPTLFADWVLSAIGGSALAVIAARFEVQMDHDCRLARVTGSFVPLAQSLLIFIAKYGIGVATALHLGSRDVLALFDLGVSGASAGYFAGWLTRFYMAYWNSPGARAAKGFAKHNNFQKE